MYGESVCVAYLDSFMYMYIMFKLFSDACIENIFYLFDIYIPHVQRYNKTK